MKINNEPNFILLLPFVLSITLIFVFSAFGQTEKNDSVAPQNNQITADENFELNIAQERITETNFVRSTNVEFTDNSRGNLRVDVGVRVSAGQIDVLLRGIFGRIRFRGSLAPIKQRLDKIQQNLQ